MGLPRAGRAFALAAAAVFFLPACHRDAGPELAPATLQTKDGWTLAATVYVPAGNGAPPGVVLVHDAGGTREAWRGFATTAQHAGYLCIAIDLRGHGDSGKDGAAKSSREFDDDDWATVTHDIAAAVQALSEAGADPENIAIVGAGAGGSAALAYAADAPHVQAVGIVSPGLELKGYDLIAIMERFPKKPLLLMASEGDSYAAATCTTLSAMAEGYCEVRTYPGSSNGLDLLALSDGAQAQLIQWLEEVIGEGHGASTPEQ